MELIASYEEIIGLDPTRFCSGQRIHYTYVREYGLSPMFMSSTFIRYESIKGKLYAFFSDTITYSDGDYKQWWTEQSLEVRKIKDVRFDHESAWNLYREACGCSSL